MKYCKWCGAKTKLTLIQMPETPILEFLEDKIDKLGRDKIWGENSNWAFIEMDSNTEAELLVYDELLNTIDYKFLCDKCIDEDNRLYEKYYENDDEIYFDDEEE